MGGLGWAWLVHNVCGLGSRAKMTAAALDSLRKEIFTWEENTQTSMIQQVNFTKRVPWWLMVYSLLTLKLIVLAPLSR